MTAEGQAALANVAQALLALEEEYPGDWVFRIDGHTDLVPVGAASRWSSNYELSMARASAVVAYLISEQGVSAARLAATGFGADRPLVDGVTAEANARNRRIELTVIAR